MYVAYQCTYDDHDDTRAMHFRIAACKCILDLQKLTGDNFYVTWAHTPVVPHKAVAEVSNIGNQ